MQFAKYKDNLKQTWKLIGTLVKRKTKEKDIAELFNNFFVNTGPTLAREIKTDHTDPLQYIESTPSNSFYLAPVTQTQVFTLFAGLKENKASLILRHYVPISTLKQLYYTLIYPYLTYGLMSWGTAYQTKLNKIKVSQNNCICCIFFANKRESPTPYFTLLEILKLENIFKLKIGALVHKIQYQKKDTPPALYDLVQPASAVHNYNTRYATNQNLCRPFSRTNYGLARFSVVASQTWEATPTKIKCLPLNSFKKEYKLFLLDSQAS
ncbi:unnamed protein product [Porites lobata]|uniref:Uncharacterized protein n=1 Tax=Porites lobata TaxID=104759 RepID=A0ABN8MPS5_9CNID|nr:unnamed protein product [Porites lobata]